MSIIGRGHHNNAPLSVTHGVSCFPVYPGRVSLTGVFGRPKHKNVLFFSDNECHHVETEFHNLLQLKMLKVPEDALCFQLSDIMNPDLSRLF